MVEEKKEVAQPRIKNKKKTKNIYFQLIYAIFFSIKL